jgi:RNA polymerase sigma factor (sigma-70 family)
MVRVVVVLRAPAGLACEQSPHPHTAGGPVEGPDPTGSDGHAHAGHDPGGWVFGEGFERLLAAARQGDEPAWTRLYLDLAPVLTGYLAGQGCPSAEDVTSETLLQVVRDLSRFDGDESRFRSWVFTIAHHRLIDARRKAQARPSDPTEDEVLEECGPRITFEDETIAHLGPSELDHLLHATTPDQRDVLLLRYVADLSLHEVADVLGKGYDAVKALHRRGLDALRAHVASEAYPQRTRRALTHSG